MNVKTELRKFLTEEGIENGKSIILKEIASIEKEYFGKLQTDEVKELETEMYQKHLSDLNLQTTFGTPVVDAEEELRNSIFRVSDPVEPKTVGIWDNNLTEGQEYRINEVSGNIIIIRDDSGELNPYLKSRFRNKSNYLTSNN